MSLIQDMRLNQIKTVYSNTCVRLQGEEEETPGAFNMKEA